ncbi:NB-ARC domain-containing protein [Spirulina sp. 06S082]|uniref:NB-ARC domain-containing protein n=1 Tax=Spirulina sp. 06S082 TaxID=3110248 RepID=UPI002B207DF1|nr:NB-ARC domain-containing protein [Spirulina sp. 06S082]MEA5468011.1 NB-ARC domain-containing protein [Spirulina sp. 06S082]
MSSVKASTEGLEIVDRARKMRKWDKYASIWCEQAQVSQTTLKRFWQRQTPIRRDNFEAICQAIALDWQDVAAPEYLPIATPKNLPKLNYIPDKRCRKVWGRDRLIQEVLNALTDPQELSILSLSGPGGYGKTEAARQIARATLKRHLFANVLWVTARQTELVGDRISAETDSDILDSRQFLHQLAIQLNCPSDRVRQHLREEKYLIILDNAETADVDSILAKLTKILNPSRALLTSRLQTNPPYVKLLPIQGLEEHWCCELLRDEANYQNIPALLEADREQLHTIYELSCGAPLALHFIVGRVLHDRTLDPVLEELKQAKGRVETFYKFCLNTAWQQINPSSRNILRYMGQMDAGILGEEISQVGKVEETNLPSALTELRRWYLLENQKDCLGNWRYSLHPWVRNSIRSNLVDRWQPSLKDIENIAKYKFNIDLDGDII